MKDKAFFIKRNDTLPVLKIKLKDRGNLGQIQQFDLTNATGATFTMVDTCGSPKIYNQTAQITSSSGGTIQYNWQIGDTDEAGVFLGEFEILFSGGAKLTVPQIGSIKIEIGEDLNMY